MYKKSKYVTLHKVFARNTRNSTCMVFKTDNYEGALYKRSPYFVGSKLWYLWSASTVNLPDIFTFWARLKRLTRNYVNLLPYYLFLGLC